ncbi:unnamed protein product [Calypogeia fissa]
MCIARTALRDTDPHSISSLSSTLEASGYRLKFSSISPDFIFNNAGASVAFIVFLQRDQLEGPEAWDRVLKMANNFQRSLLMITVPINEDARFIEVCLSNRHKLRKTFVMPIRDWSMALRQMVQMADGHAASKHHDSIPFESAEQLEFVNSSDAVIHAICSIPGLELHDAHSLLYGMGSLEAISQATAESLKKHTDLSHEKAVAVVEFFRNDGYNRRQDLI